MANIPNTEYITINKNGIFVGGKPATHYRGQEIFWIDNVRKRFASIQKLNKNVMEFHVLSSETRGKYAKAGNPSSEHGQNAWCRVAFQDGTLGTWMSFYTFGSATSCANACAGYCMDGVHSSSTVRSALFGDAFTETQKLKKINFSKLPNQPIELNGYRILVEKIGPKTK